MYRDYYANSVLIDAIQNALSEYKKIMFEGQSIELIDVNINQPIQITSKEHDENKTEDTPCMGKCFCDFEFWRMDDNDRMNTRCGNICVWFTIIHYDTNKQEFEVQIDNEQILLDSQNLY